MKHGEWEWRGLVAGILALGLAVSMIATALGIGTHLTQEETTLLSTVLGATVGALGTYLGGRHTPNGGTNGNGSTSTNKPNTNAGTIQ